MLYFLIISNNNALFYCPNNLTIIELIEHLFRHVRWSKRRSEFPFVAVVMCELYDDTHDRVLGELCGYPWKFITRYDRFFNVIRVAIYARVHETGLPVAWSAGRCRKHVENHRARCVIDPRCRDYRAIAYRTLSFWYRRESGAHIFFSLNNVDAIIIVEIAESSWIQVEIYYRVYFDLSTGPRPRYILTFLSSWSAFPSLFLFLILVSRVPSCTMSHASFYWNPTFPFTDGLSEIAGKFFTSGRHESYNSTFQRGPPLGRVGMSRYENEEQCAIARGKGIFSAAAILRMLLSLRDDGREYVKISLDSYINSSRLILKKKKTLDNLKIFKNCFLRCLLLQVCNVYL